ncbi:hypothetical protein PR048_023540 [Dryococelus australis]|uniref:Uncharacterized protein n=1 Tax=Dryococelus australis TaxID=614101 RepID=A0ABQ9GUD1_9NEOP|nr:hypothetical protein PR048_023540 [Dryococelus australis]
MLTAEHVELTAVCGANYGVFGACRADCNANRRAKAIVSSSMRREPLLRNDRAGSSLPRWTQRARGKSQKCLLENRAKANFFPCDVILGFGGVHGVYSQEPIDPTSVQSVPRQSQCSRVLQAPSCTVGFTRRYHTLSSIQATNTSLAVALQSPVVHTYFARAHSVRRPPSKTAGRWVAPPPRLFPNLRRGGLRHQPVSPEHSCVVAKRIGNSRRRDEVCDASKSRRCRHSRDSQKERSGGRERIVPGRGEGEVGLRLRRRAAESAPAAALPSQHEVCPVKHQKIVTSSCSPAHVSINMSQNWTRSEVCSVQFSLQRWYSVPVPETSIRVNVRVGAAVVERLDRSHLNKANRVQYPAGITPGVSYLPFAPPMHDYGSPLFSSHVTLIGSPDSLLNAAQITQLSGTVGNPSCKAVHLPGNRNFTKRVVKRLDGNAARLARRSDEALGVRVVSPVLPPRFLNLDVQLQLTIMGSTCLRCNSHRYTQHYENTARQSRALCVKATALLSRVPVTLIAPTLLSRKRRKTMQTGGALKGASLVVMPELRAWRGQTRITLPPAVHHSLSVNGRGNISFRENPRPPVKSSAGGATPGGDGPV